MFMLASSSLEDDRDPSSAGLSVNCREIYSNSQSNASSVLTSAARRRFLCVDKEGDVGNRVIRQFGPAHAMISRCPEVTYSGRDSDQMAGRWINFPIFDVWPGARIAAPRPWASVRLSHEGTVMGKLPQLLSRWQW
jgi:hypothetical protein